MKPYIAIPFFLLFFALPTKAERVEINETKPLISATASEKGKASKPNVKRDRDSETCSDRGCARFKERGSGRVGRNPDRK